MDKVSYIKNKYGVDGKIIDLPISRWKEFPLLLNEFGVKNGVEIGTYKGDYAETLMKLMPQLDLTVVDAWTVYQGYKDYGVNDLEDVAYNIAIERSKKFGFKIIKAWSNEAVNQFEDESLDFVFIDGNHDFEHVVEDVAKWSRKVKKGGIVSGHDFNRNHAK